MATKRSTDNEVLRTRQFSDPAELGVEITLAIADITDRDPTELPQLDDSIDTDALEELFREEARRPVRVSFDYCGYSVVLTGDGTVQVRG